MYNELIDALQCTRHFALYQDCYEKNCYANSGKGLYCNIPKLMADAADAIERLTADRNKLKDKLILNICSHCDSRFDYCGECPIIKDINEAFDEQ